MYTIATLEDLRRRLKLADDDTGSDDELLRALAEASHLVESASGRRFCPRLATLEVRPDAADPRALILPDDLLELRALNDDAGALDLADIAQLPGHGDEPASVLQLNRGLEFRLGLHPARSVSVSGVWGWHDRWTQAWRDSGARVQGGGLAAAATVIPVRDSHAADADGLRPRFHVGHLLRVDAEYLRVTAIDRAANQLTVLRGVGGTQPQTQARDATIETYAPAPAIRDLTLRYAELLSKSVGLLPPETPPLLKRLRRLTG